jgi:putative redox protein
MILVTNRAGATQSLVAAGKFSTQSDATPPAGKGAGFRPHELLEAALASCTAITLRMLADERGLALEAAVVSVELDRSNPQETTFRTLIDLRGELSEDQRDFLVRAARACPVRKTLSKRLSFIDADVLG